jgi:CRISPR/Cas system-associated exonuclease Cas4 (RecB family)
MVEAVEAATEVAVTVGVVTEVVVTAAEETAWEVLVVGVTAREDLAGAEQAGATVV